MIKVQAVNVWTRTAISEAVGLVIHLPSLQVPISGASTVVPSCTFINGPMNAQINKHAEA
jgi:hypothetical protein